MITEILGTGGPSPSDLVPKQNKKERLKMYLKTKQRTDKVKTVKKLCMLMAHDYQELGIVGWEKLHYLRMRLAELSVDLLRAESKWDLSIKPWSDVAEGKPSIYPLISIWDTATGRLIFSAKSFDELAAYVETLAMHFDALDRIAETEETVTKIFEMHGMPRVSKDHREWGV